MSLSEFLEKKPLYYNKIDYDRMPRIYQKIKPHFKQIKTIHIIGTNGKGTTGRFLATALHKQGFKVGHYTSPHILVFNERIWLEGENVSDALLESSHESLQKLLDKEDLDALSYFEYTTFLAMLIFNACDFIVLEAGLGGVHDATAVFPKDLTLVTPIAYDHEAFLGSNIESIANEKLNAIQNNAILAYQEYLEVYEKSYQLKSEKNLNIMRINEVLADEDFVQVTNIANTLSLVPYLEDNLALSIAALKFFNLNYSVDDFHNSKLFGRLSQINENIIIDVGHNPLAAVSIQQALKDEKYILVYNTYADKEYEKILDILKPIISYVEIIDIDDKRIVKIEELQTVLTDLEIKYHKFSAIDKNQKYLVFGSFSVIEKFLKVYNE